VQRSRHRSATGSELRTHNVHTRYMVEIILGKEPLWQELELVQSTVHRSSRFQLPPNSANPPKSTRITV
jgi:hypothetical protein